jgi:hypothetical protein
MGVYFHKRCDAMANPKRSAIPKSMEKKEAFSSSEHTTEPDPNKKRKRNRLEDMVPSRKNVGARNPFVIALHKIALTGKKVIQPSVKHRFSPADLEKLMKEAFGDNAVAYKDLFNPKSGSPVYYGIAHATRKLARSMPELHKQFLSPSGPDVAGEGAPPDFCADLTRSKDPSPMPRGLPAVYVNAVPEKNQGLEFNDPVQGCLADCWLIAPISSVAWAETNGYPPSPAVKKLARSIVPPPNPPPPFLYPPWVTTATKRSITTSTDFYLDQNLDPYYCRTNNIMLKLHPLCYAMWGPFYEKCFASYYQQKRMWPWNTINNPDYNVLNYGSEYDALADLTGKIVSSSTSAKTLDYFGTPDNDAGMIELIRRKACNGDSIPDESKFLATNKPMVACTYYDNTYIPGEANDPQKNYTPLIAAYNCGGISANHVYSVLGLYQKNNIKYVVLRNPWGFAGTQEWFGPYLKDQMVNIPAFDYIVNPGAEGIFGLHSITFMRYFEKFGWVT